MNHRGYPTSLAVLRGKLEALILLPDSAREWPSFVRQEMKLPEWMLPAVQAAVRQGGWRTAADPVIQIRSAVHKLAIEMRLRNHDKVAVVEEEEEEEESR